MKSVLLKILLILSFLPFSQVWGADFIPAITNYTVKDYEGGHQNWACAQGDDLSLIHISEPTRPY